MTLPNFVLVGAGRSGTTTLYAWLARHPEIFMAPRKSVDFHVRDDPQPAWENTTARRMADQRVVRRLEDYAALFEDAGARRAVGEVSPVYLQSVRVAERIHALTPDARIVAILRHPVERAYAHFLGRQRDGIEPAGPFEARVAKERALGMPDDVAFGHYLGCGRYHHFLSPYFGLFPRDQLRIYLFEDLQRDPAGLLADLFGFLGVDPSIRTDLSERRNRSGLIANPLLRRLWTATADLRTMLRPHLPQGVRRAAGSLFLSGVRKVPLDPALRGDLIELYREDIAQLGPMIDRDLSHWLKT